MANVLEIGNQIVRFLAREQSLNDFNIWLARHTWNLHLEEPQVRSLVGAIELALAEHSNGGTNQDDLRKSLSDLVSVQHVGAQESPTTSTASVVVRVLTGAQAP